MDQDWLFQWLNLEENNSIQFPSSAMHTEGHWMVLSITMMVTIRSSKVGTTDIRAVWFSLLLGGHLVLCRVLAISWPLSSCSQFTLSQLQQLKTSSGITQCLLGSKTASQLLENHWCIHTQAQWFERQPWQGRDTPTPHSCCVILVSGPVSSERGIGRP